MHNEKHQFEVKKNRRYQRVGRGGGYVVGGIPWSQLYYGGYGYYGGYYGGVGPGNNNNNPNETAQNGFGQESGDGGTGDVSGSGGDSASGGGD